ncbi:MAG: C25 family cysteine peptidase [Candidatus Cloacimonadaceae bacterium]|nr:C25 family cysteine peptidase [Candidatus Cloacimonadota bacterium]MDD4560598.1 C25 family cysteine peptidase [Candidatus Cloacimonadota bacterium]
MKRSIVLILLSLMCGLAFSSEAEISPTSFKSAFEISHRSSQNMDLEFHLPQFQVTPQMVGSQSFHRIELPGAATLMQSGMPELPVITTTIAIPYQGTVNVEVLSSDQSIISEFNAYPLQQGSELESPKSFIQNTQYYSSGGQYPAAAVEYSDPMILRDFRIITLQVNPFSYNAESQELTVHNNISLRLSFDAEPGINELSAPVQYISPAFDKTYASIIQNYDDYRDLLIANTPPRYLIIHGQSSDNLFNVALNAYVTWKRQKGADVDVVPTGSSGAGSNTSSIQSYIRGRYNNLETRPDYVILIGDTQGSFPIPAFTNNSGATDYPYTHMNTGDMLGDIFIGRISVADVSQFLVVLNKIYLYEKDINVDQADWLNHMLLVGDNDPSGISTMYLSKYIKEMALEVNPDNTFTELYGPTFSAFTTGITTAFNEGISFYSFRGYIDFSPPSAGSLYNGQKLPHAVTITCATGNFDSSSPSETEDMIRQGTTAAPKGTVTAIGMSTSSTHTTFNNVLHGGIFEGIFARDMRTMGEAALHGKLYINQIFGISSPLNAEKFAHWCNLMGDPTMEVFTGIPDQFQMQTEGEIPLGLKLLDVAITDTLSQAPVEGASVVLSLDSDILSRGYTDAEGNVILVLPDTMLAGEAIITVSKHNYKPLQRYINIVNVPTLVAGNIVIDDATSSLPNGVANAGETVNAYFGLRNTGQDTISGISGTVTCDSPWINIPNPAITYGDIPGGATLDSTNPLVIELSPATPNGTMLRIHLNLSAGEGNSYQVSEFISVQSPVIEVSTQTIFGDMDADTDSAAPLSPEDGILDPGEMAQLVLGLSNASTVPVTGLSAKLYTRNDLLSVQSDLAEVGDLSETGQINTVTFSVWLRPQTLVGMQIPLYVKLYNDAGFEQIVDFSITAGSPDSDNPLGPDEYGYVIYDDTDGAPDEIAGYNWVSISPNSGGFGTPLPISDILNGSDEGDQVGAQSLAVVDLPFPFRFYGKYYTQITVCSNGFIALGVTENAEFRNFRLPGAMGPSPMIAPFWDDLATHSGSGIYTLFDRRNHAFIVEWNNLLNGGNGTSPETFQVILYDQSVYNTSLGDGPIKFQYHTFNNVDSQSGSEHGNYCTIGIEDHTGTRGLEYTFNNTYPQTCAPLSSGKALFISNVPTYYEAANLLIAETYTTDPNNVIEPGEFVNMGILLENTGNIIAEDIMATLSTDSPYINFINASSDYFPLQPGENGVNRYAYRFTVSEDCPSDELINFNLHVQTDEAEWNHALSIRVEAPKLRYHSYMINDYHANFDGVINPSEAVQLIVNLQNTTDVQASEVTATLTSEVPNLVIGNPHISGINVGANQIMQLAFNLDFSGVDTSLENIPLNFSAYPLGGEGAEAQLNLPFNQPNVAQNFDFSNGNFVSETGWTWGIPQNVEAHSGSKVWGTNLQGQYPINVQYHLYTPRYTLETGSQLSFMHYYGTEPDFDGVNLAISTNNGNSWTILTPAGGYDNTAIVGLNMEAGWTGNSNAWVPATFDLSAYDNQEVMFRFRLGSNGATNGIGWYIDDFLLTNVNLKTGFLYGSLSASSGLDPAKATVMSTSRYATRPNSDGNYKLFLPNGTHSVSALMEHHQSSNYNNFQISPENPVVSTDFVLIDLPGVSELDYELSENSVDLELSWQAPVDPVLSISGYRVYKRFNSGPFELVQESSAMSFSESRPQIGYYYYYVCAVYAGEEGTPSQTLLIGNPYSDTQENESPSLVTGLAGNYPNPFNPTTTIAFSLAEAGPAKLFIYNIKGQLVRQLANSDFNAGKHFLVWDGRDNGGHPVSSGLYFYRLSARNYSKTRKMILMK